MNVKMDVHDYLPIVMEITSGMQDLEKTMRRSTHDSIATVYVKQKIKEAKQAPDIDN